MGKHQRTLLVDGYQPKSSKIGRSAKTGQFVTSKAPKKLPKAKSAIQGVSKNKG